MAGRWSRETLRRRIAPLVFLIALATLGARTCASEAAEVDLRLYLGEAAAELRSLRVDVFRDEGEDDARDRGVAYLERSYTGATGAAAAPPSFELQLAPGSYRVRIELELERASGREHRVLERAIVVGESLGEQTQVRIQLTDELTDERATGNSAS